MAKAYLNIGLDPRVAPIAVTVVGIFSEPAGRIPGGDYGFWAGVYEAEADTLPEAAAEVRRRLDSLAVKLPHRFLALKTLYLNCLLNEPERFEIRGIRQ